MGSASSPVSQSADLTENITDSIKISSQIVVEFTTLSDWRLRSDWLESMLKKRVAPESMEAVRYTIDALKSSLAVIFDGPLKEKLEMFRSLGVVDVLDSPLDVRWNPMLKERLMKSSPQVFKELESYLNQ